MKSKFGLALACLLVSLVVAVSAGELVLRQRERSRDTVPGVMPFLHYRHGRLETALVRNGSYYDWVHVNAQGFRGPREVGLKKDGVVRIMTVGGSTTFDSFVTADDRAWPARLEHWLATNAPGCGFEVINAGVPGYRMLHSVIRLQTELYEYDPDIIILYHAHNDLLYLLFGGGERARGDPNRPFETPTESKLERWLGRHSLLYGKVMYRLKVLGRRKGEPPELRGSATRMVRDSLTDLEAAAFERDLASFLAIARTLGFVVVIPQVTHVSGAGQLAEPDSTLRRRWHQGFAGVRPEIVLAGYAKLDMTAREQAARFSALYLPTSEFDLRGAPWYVTGDPIHFNDQGADRMAAGVAKGLLESELLAQCGTGAADRTVVPPVSGTTSAAGADRTSELPD